MITNIAINWMDGFSNNPSIKIESDQKVEWPNSDRPVWAKYASGIHVAQLPGSDFVHYFYTDGKPTEGFGGRLFEGRFRDTGDSFRYRGAWSSRAACVNAEMSEGLQVVDVTCDYLATAVRASALIAAWRKMQNPGFGFAWVDTGDAAPILMPVRNLEPVKNPDRNRILRFVNP